MAMSLGRCLRGTCKFFTILGFVSLYGAYFVYEVFDSGTLILDGAPGLVTITREADTQILHIKGDDTESISYG